MPDRAGRVTAGAVAWVATALLAGYLIGPWFAPAGVGLPEGPGASGVESADPATGTSPSRAAAGVALPALDPSAPPAAPQAPAPPRTGASRANHPPAEPAVATDPADPTALPSRARVLTGLATGRLVVRVTGPEGEPASGWTVYALPAGGPGSDDEDEILSAVTEDGEAILDVPADVRVDVGVASEAGTALRTDVVVAAGAEQTVALAVAGAAAITAELRDAPRELLAGPLQVAVQLAGVDGAEGRCYPGRADRAWTWGTSFALDRDGRADSGPLTPGARYLVTASVRVAPGTPPRWSGPWRLVAEPSEAAPGDHVVLRLAPSARVRLTPAASGRSNHAQPMAQLRVLAGGQPIAVFPAFYEQLTGEPPPAPTPIVPPGTDPAQAELMRQAAALQHAQRQLALRHQWMPFPFDCAVPPGPVRIDWSGAGVEPGSRDLGVLAADTTTEVSVAVRFTDEPAVVAVTGPQLHEDAGDVEPNGEVTVTLHGLPPGDPAGDPPPVGWFLAREEDPGDEPDVLDDEIDRTTPTLWLHPDDRRRALLGVAHAGPWLATDPVPMRDRTTLRLDFRPAGLLLVLPGRLALPETPAVLLSRPDGAPLPYADTASDLSWDDAGRVSPTWGPGRAAVRVRARLGRVLGPLPAGPVRLQVRRGGFLLGDVTATVVAGQIRPVVLAP